MFSRFSLSAFATLTAAGVLAADPTDPAVKLDHFVVSASPFQRNQTDLAQATSILTGTALSLRQQPSLGETLAGLPGISSTFFGPGASRPIIRGLGGDRVRILENGTGTIDASTVSPDHAVSVEPFLISRIEVVRGPAALLYGSTAVGGVVNLLTHRIETELPARPVSGLFDGRAGTGAGERAFGGIVNLAAAAGDGRAVVLHLDGFRRETGDVKIPGYARSAAIRTAETAAAGAGRPEPEFAYGVLPNSAVDSRGGAAGLSFVSTSGHLGLAYSGFDSLYGVPKEADVQIDLRQRRLDLQGETTQTFGPFSGARVKVGAADYAHRELEEGMVGTTFSNRGYDARVELLHADLGGLAGAWGVQAGRNRLAALGDEAFLPSSQTVNRALFAFEEFQAGAFTPQFGGRVETQRITLHDGTGRTRDDRMFSLAVGTVWNPVPGWVVGLSLTRTERAPNAQELYADGPHLGTGSFEIGDDTLTRERSLGTELNLRRRVGFVTGEVSVFANRFRGFIHEVATGEVAVELGGPVLIVPGTVLPGEETLAVYRFTSTDADFRGAEAEAVFHLHETARHKLDLRFAMDFTRAEDGRGRALPRIPALRHTMGVAWQQGPWHAGADWQVTRAQNRVGANEEPSNRYHLLSAHAAWRWERGHGAWEIFVRGSNLTNEEVRPHTSYLKNIAPLPGRNIGVGVKWIF